MNGFIIDLEDKTLSNEYFREVLYTTTKSQLVVMSLMPNEEIGEETHQEHDQFIRIETGQAKVILDGEERDVSDGYAIVIPAGVKHNVINTSVGMLKLYTIYTPPEHKDATIHKTKQDAS